MPTTFALLVFSLGPATPHSAWPSAICHFQAPEETRGPEAVGRGVPVPA